MSGVERRKVAVIRQQGPVFGARDEIDADGAASRIAAVRALLGFEQIPVVLLVALSIFGAFVIPWIPLLIVVMGVCVGGMIISLYLPMFNIIKLIK